MDVRLAKLLRKHAANVVSAAIEVGELPALNGSSECVDCGAPATDYDHRDYRRPLKVAPVCHGCNLRRGQGLPLLPAIKGRARTRRKSGRPFDRSLLPPLTPITTSFPAIVSDLKRAGWSQSEVAKETGTTQTNISELLRGREPKYYLGKRLVELHERVTNE